MTRPLGNTEHQRCRYPGCSLSTVVLSNGRSRMRDGLTIHITNIVITITIIIIVIIIITITIAIAIIITITIIIINITIITITIITITIIIIIMHQCLSSSPMRSSIPLLKISKR